MHLITHGILHLLGYDHQTPRQANKMEALETRILKSFGVKNPYASISVTDLEHG
jgi:probable rRNA maturation factor